MGKTLEERAAEAISLDHESHYTWDKESLIELIADQQDRIWELENQPVTHLVPLPHPPKGE